MEEKVLQLGERRAITLKIWLKDTAELRMGFELYGFQRGPRDDSPRAGRGLLELALRNTA